MEFTKEFIQDKLLGQVIDGRYQVLPDGFLGEGGFGFVLRGQHLRLGEKIRDIAIKVIKQEIEQDMEKDIFREAFLQMASVEDISDPQAREHLTKVYDFGIWEVEDGQEKTAKRRIGYIIMEFVKGGDLSKECKLFPDKKMPENIATRYIIQVCRALRALHKLPEPVIHRDIKPENVMLAERLEEGKTEKQAKITDFGLAYRLNKGFQWAEGVAGTQVYMAPESLKGSGASIPASDVFSLGVAWYQLITGRLPFDDEYPPHKKEDAKARDWRYHRRQKIIPPAPRQFNSTCTERISDILLKCLQFEPKNRYKDAGELLRELESSPGPERLAEDGIKAFEKEEFRQVIQLTEALFRAGFEEKASAKADLLLSNLAIACTHEHENEKAVRYAEIVLNGKEEKMKNEKAFCVARSLGIALTELGEHQKAAKIFYKLRTDEEKGRYGIVSRQERKATYEAEIKLHKLLKNESKVAILNKKLGRL